jgi:glycosyltransferase involved in cell wall biosynthesis
MVNILFVTYHDFTSNSAIQIHNFANNLVKSGNDCCIAVPSNKNSVYDAIGGEILYKPLNFPELQNYKKIFRNAEIPDIIHAWTPREIVRRQSLSLLKMFKCKLIVHLEDNEELLLEDSLSIPIDQLKLFSLEKLNELVPETASHPIFYQEFLQIADGITLIIDNLVDFIPKNKKFIVLWPGIDKSRFNPELTDIKLKSELGINEEDIVLCYTGNVHSSNAKEVRSLYLAVALLNREGIPTKLIRTGKDFVPFLGDSSAWAHQYSIELGFVPHQKISTYLGISDILVQPGGPNRFNEYRLPSKLPEFFFMGKPVILPLCNIGRFIKNYEQGLLLGKGDSLDILEKVKLLVKDKDLSNRIGVMGREFALREFDSEKNTRKLEEFYKSVLGGMSQPEAPPHHSSYLFKKYKDHVPEELSYAKVRDFCDSADNFRELCNQNGDLKNVQRPWMIKAIIASVPYGGKLVEIGAGEPKVANFLNKLGYEVTIIDPYDGTGNGPKEYNYFKKTYPNLTIIKDYFENGITVLNNKSHDCVYSISVLEHVPDEKINEIFNGIRKIVKPGGFSIHCIDHVILGNGAKEHDEKIRLILNEHDLLPVFDMMLNQSKEDVETYYLSAEGHNLWRGIKKYEEFPFRRVISVQIKKEI